MVCCSGRNPLWHKRSGYQRWVRIVKCRSPAAPSGGTLLFSRSDRKALLLLCTWRTIKIVSYNPENGPYQESEGVLWNRVPKWGAVTDFILTVSSALITIRGSCLHDQGGKLYWYFHSKYPKFGYWVPGFPSWTLSKGTPEESSLARWIRDAFPKLVLHREFSLVDSFFSPSLRTICLRGTRKNRHLFRFVGLAPGRVPIVLPSRWLGYLWTNPQISNYWGLQVGVV